MAKQIKGGYLLRYKKRFFGKTWREEWVTLFDDSTLAWFKEKDKGAPVGVVVLKDAPEMMAVGHWTLRIPMRPELPSGCQVVQLMAFGTRCRGKVHWLLAKDEMEVSEWMSAISNTLPPPPPLLSDKETTAEIASGNPRLPLLHYRNTFVDCLGGQCIYRNLNHHQRDKKLVSVPVADNDMSHVTTGVLLASMHHHWGHGWGWTSSSLSSLTTASCYEHTDHQHCHIAFGDSSVAHGAVDDYDLEIGDSDYSIGGFGGDFGF